TTQPSMVVGLVSGNGVGVGVFGRRGAVTEAAADAVFGCAAGAALALVSAYVPSRRPADPVVVEPSILPAVATPGLACRGGSAALAVSVATVRPSEGGI